MARVGQGMWFYITVGYLLGVAQGTWPMGTENPIYKMGREEEKGRDAEQKLGVSTV